MFRAHVLIVRRAKLYYTVSGIIIPIGGGPVHGTATYKCDDTKDCIIQFCPPDDEHMCLKHVEAWNKLIIKFSASSWLILINKYIEMHGQQNIKTFILRVKFYASLVSEEDLEKPLISERNFRYPFLSIMKLHGPLGPIMKPQKIFS